MRACEKYRNMLCKNDSCVGIDCTFKESMKVAGEFLIDFKHVYVGKVGGDEIRCNKVFDKAGNFIRIYDLNHQTYWLLDNVEVMYEVTKDAEESN